MIALSVLSCSFMAATDILEVMTANARRKGKDPQEFQWDNRKQQFIDLILSKKPTIIGFQEVVKGEQFDDLKKGLSGYQSFGDSRNEHASFLSLQWLISKHWNANNECSPIFYNPEEVTSIASATFGINPYYFSQQKLPRICTWGLFEDKKSQKQFYVYNTHLDNESEEIRLAQLKIILKHRKTGKHNQSIPAIIMGDLNTKIEGKIKNKFEKAGFIDAAEKATIVKGPKETRTGWHNKELKEIDHILVKNMDVEEYEVVKSPEGVYVSDHRPVMAKIILK